MRILIVEDNDLKFRRVNEIFDVDDGYVITRAKNQRTALSNLRQGHDVILLDMTFEVLENKSQTATLQALAGLQVLQYMKRSGVQIPTIVITQHSSFHQPGTPIIPDIQTLDHVLKENFPLIYCGFVFMTESNEWKDVLRGLMVKI